MNELQDIDIKEIAEIVSTILKQDSIDTKIASLEGLHSRLKIDFWKTIQVSFKGKSIYPRKTPCFFYQDYECISDAMLPKYLVQKLVPAPLMYDDTSVEITENKRSYLLAIVIENEIERFKQQKKGLWKGKIHESSQVKTTFEITQNQEKEILEIFTSYNVGTDKTSYELIKIVTNCDLSCFYTYKTNSKQPKDIVRVHSVIVSIDKILGRDWGTKACRCTTKVLENGPRTFAQIQKNYRSAENF